MPTSARFIVLVAALLGALGVLLGAFGAHGLRQRLAPELLALWQTAVQYHLWHALAMLGVGLLSLHFPQHGWLRAAALLLFAGIVLFSGSLYALALGAPRVLGAATPLGGLSLIAGWGCLAIAAFRLG
jgi:uncharacterized membrane protein YgdD (TMEM256/DUF423 family)